METDTTIVEPSNGDGALAPYFPDYLGGIVATTIQLILFHAFLLVFIIKLVKWSGRTWFMTRKFVKDREVVVGNFDEAGGGSISVGWVDQFWGTTRKAFRDWCWPPVPTAATPFQKWIDDTSQKMEDALYAEYEAHDLPQAFIQTLENILLDFSLAVDYQGYEGNWLKTIGASNGAIEHVERMRDEIGIVYSSVSQVTEWNDFDDDQKIEFIANHKSKLRWYPNDLRAIASYGRRPSFDVSDL